ncbi:hypothetical protein [Desulfofustis phage LS06-2018-MD01]|nr:hypothetical protein [Desulfofustis phage LS06-2018-MD01]
MVIEIVIEVVIERGRGSESRNDRLLSPKLGHSKINGGNIKPSVLK